MKLFCITFLRKKKFEDFYIFKYLSVIPNNNAPPPGSVNNQQFLPTRLPSDQEIGITPATLISDPNYNVGSHPGEIYLVDSNGKRSQKIPPRRYFNQYYTSSRPSQQYYPYYSVNYSICFETLLYFDTKIFKKKIHFRIGIQQRAIQKHITI